MRTSNPTLGDHVFERSRTGNAADGVMTLNGTVIKTAILTLLLVTGASWSWKIALEGNAPSWFGTALTFGWIVPLGVALVISFVPKTAPALAPLYAITKGVIIGIISALYEKQFGGIVLTAVMITCGILFALLAAYMTGMIKPTENFKLGIFAATGGIALFYLAAWVLGMFGIQIPGLFGNGWVGIAFSGFVVVIAALNLVLDFDFIENGCASGAPKHMEWYAAFGLLVTLVWLYLEILRLLAKLRSRD
ncbi:Bax inhibitor-1/YccA family protein [Prosthecobacter sp.]|uniref:Bax inhibitor-1/YccA family protein n=1 Tax=Prosthecobacter sp. TaxID=1965333 RepID=UPI002ABA0564|nr:Bax inhibitor-1/YccA family protein [Prosthecobacter sp.]MDZ4401039.1 Bax inhibitor-1/YccA family protein [Prosthecobacter sp.]